jgi:hypothetical protein
MAGVDPRLAFALEAGGPVAYRLNDRLTPGQYGPNPLEYKADKEFEPGPAYCGQPGGSYFVTLTLVAIVSVPVSLMGSPLV